MKEKRSKKFTEIRIFEKKLKFWTKKPTYRNHGKESKFWNKFELWGKKSKFWNKCQNYGNKVRSMREKNPNSEIKFRILGKKVKILRKKFWKKSKLID